MAYTPCAANLGANIAVDCSNPPRAGFTGEGILIDLGDVTPSVSVSSTNPRILESITVESGDKVCVVDNLWRDSMVATIAQNVENGRTTWDKTLPIRIPERSAVAAKNVIEPLASSHFLGIFPTVDQRFIVLGYYGKFQASENSQSEGENGGDFASTMSVNEPFAVVELKSTDYAATKTIYDALKAKAF